jgi:hypothetical protein
MSNIAIQGAATGTGVFTLASPATNTNRTLTLPDEAGTIDTLQRAGNVLQVLQTVKTDTGSFISNLTDNFVDLSGLSISITPISTSSKILVSFTANVSNTAGATTHLRLVRDSTPIYIGDSAGSRLSSSAFSRTAVTPYNLELPNLNGTFLDSPNTTSSVTYKLQGTLGASYNGTYYINRTNLDTDANYGGRTASQITVMEIAG